MTTRITTQMLFAVGGGGITVENVGRVRRILEAAGVADIELHALEVANVLHYREQARLLLATVDRLLAAGPLPEHACEIFESSGIVQQVNDCPVGCNAGKTRIEIEP